jgi:RNA polymerase sigma-70 factor (ECF subfamily)
VVAQIDVCNDGQTVDIVVLFVTYHHPVYRTCLRYLADSGEAEDAAQEVFIRAWKNLSSFNPLMPGGALPWLEAIAENYCLDRLRQRKAFRRLFTKLIQNWAAPVNEPQNQAADVADCIKALGLLSETHRVVWVLRYHQGYSCPDIARRLDTPVGNVYRYLYEAREQLKGLVEDNPDLDKEDANG